MATNVVHRQSAQNETREFVLGLAIAFVVMVAVVLGTLYLVGDLGWPRAGAGDETATPIVYSADDLAPAAKPTAVWKFRSDWQKPAQP